MNRFQFRLKKLASVSPKCNTERRKDDLTLSDIGITSNNGCNDDGDCANNFFINRNKITGMSQPTNELKQNMKKVMLKENNDNNAIDTSENTKDLARDLVKNISNRIDQIGQEINLEIHQIRKDLSQQVRNNNNRNKHSDAQYVSNNLENQLVIDGDELIMNDIKLRVESFKTNFQKISNNNKEKVQVLKHSMSARVKKRTDSIQVLSSSRKMSTKEKMLNMRIPTVTLPTVTMPNIMVPSVAVPPKQSKGNNMIGKLKRKLQKQQPDKQFSHGDISYDSETDENTIDFSQSGDDDIFCDESITSYGSSDKNSLDESAIALDINKYGTSWGDDSIDHHFSISDDEDDEMN